MSRKKVRSISTAALERLQRRQAAAAEKPTFVIKAAWPTAVIQCLCRPNEHMLVIVGDAAELACPACGTKRRIRNDWSMNIVPV